MAYNRKYILSKILMVQQIYNQYHDMGLSNIRIYEKHIAPTYYISKSTFYAYLNINAKKDLRELQSKQAGKGQLALFEA